MKITVDTFEQFIDGSWDYDIENECHTGIWIHPTQMDIFGGIITKEEIDCLSMYDNIEYITITGLNQKTFEYFIHKYGKKIKAIRFFKNQLVEDFSVLGTLSNIEFIYWFHNQKITKLWDMSQNINLKGLCISDFSLLKNLDGIEKAPHLEWFSIRDAVWDKTEIDSFSCFKNTPIKYLHFGGKKILDGNLSFIKDMPKLVCFDCSPSLFETNKIAWVMANCPHVHGKAFHVFIDDLMYNEESKMYDIAALRLTGKRKRCFHANDDYKKKKLQEEFMNLIECYRNKNYDDLF